MTKKPISDHLLHFLHTKVAFAHRKAIEKMAFVKHKTNAIFFRLLF